jgi:hypothetical protein
MMCRACGTVGSALPGREESWSDWAEHPACIVGGCQAGSGLSARADCDAHVTLRRKTIYFWHTGGEDGSGRCGGGEPWRTGVCRHLHACWGWPRGCGCPDGTAGGVRSASSGAFRRHSSLSADATACAVVGGADLGSQRLSDFRRLAPRPFPVLSLSGVSSALQEFRTT